MNIKKYNCSSKAKLLHLIQAENLNFIVPSLISFTVKELEQSSSEIFDRISDTFQTKIIIRSSASDEDGKSSSSAGEYDSVLNVSVNNPEKITKAINRVIASYEKKRPLMADDEVII